MKLQLHSRIAKEALIKASRQRKLTAAECGGPKDRNIYVSEHHTRATLDLRQRAKEQLVDWKYVWIGKAGQILARKRDGEKCVHINGEEDIGKHQTKT